MNRLLAKLTHLPVYAFQTLLHTGDAAERAEVVAEVEHERRSIAAGAEGATELLMKDDRRFRGTDHHDCVDTADVDCLIELVDTVEHLERITVVLFKLLKVLRAIWVSANRFVSMNDIIHTMEPFVAQCHKLLQLLIVGTEHDYLRIALLQVLRDGRVNPSGILQRAAQLLVLLRELRVFLLVLDLLDGDLQLPQFLGSVVECDDVLRDRQDAAKPSLLKFHAAGDVALEDLIGHIAPVIREADWGRAETDQFRIGASVDKPLDSLAPLGCPAMMELV